MIINHPTGLYKTVLPDSPESSANIIYTISNQDPPRSALSFLQLSRNVDISRTDTKISNKTLAGDAVYSVTKGDKNQIISGVEYYKFGSTFGFDDVEILLSKEQVTNKLENRHDIGSIDYEAIGVDKSTIDPDLFVQLQDYKAELSSLQEQYNNLYIQINNNIKLSNEISLAIDGLNTLKNPSDNIINTKNDLAEQKEELQDTITSQKVIYDAIPNKIDKTKKNINMLSRLIK